MAPPTAGAPGPAGPREPADLRVVGWNVRSLRDDVGAVVEVLRRLGPDVVCLQEAPRFWRWRHALSELARRSRLLYACGGATTGGPALLTALRVQVDAVHEWRLTRTPGHFQRGVAAAEVRLAGARLVLASTHLGLDPPERERHAAEVLRLLEPLRAPYAVLAGDLNETDTGRAWATLTAGRFRDAYAVAPLGAGPTFPARAPRRRIDAVLVDGLTVRRCGVPDDVDPGLLARASDHLPVVADLRLHARG